MGLRARARPRASLGSFFEDSEDDEGDEEDEDGEDDEDDDEMVSDEDGDSD